MKTFMFLFVTFLVASVLGQYENTSFYFSIDNLKDETTFSSFKGEEVGFYSINEDRRRHLIVDPDSISVRSGFEIILPKKVAVQKGFTFKNDKMYGMEPYNGIQYTEVDDTILALYYQFDHYLGDQDIVITGKEGYFLFTKELSGFYSCEYLSFTEEGIIIASIDHVEVMPKLLKFKNIYSKEISGIQTYILQPSLKDLESLEKKDCFNDLRNYPKVEHL